MVIWLEDDALMTLKDLSRIVEDSLRANGLSAK